jgi:protein phosphatase
LVIHTRIADIAGLSDVGKCRRSNQDAIAWDAKLGLALVADGVGGGNAGEIASATAARSITGDLRAALLADRIHDPRPISRDSRAALVQELVRRANQRILAAALRQPALNGMQTTLAMTLLADDFITVASLGDSRIYRLRDVTLLQLTRDHNVAAELAALGHLSLSQVARSALRGTLSRALGVSSSSDVDIEHHPLESGDRLMLCSDGLTKAIHDPEIAEILAGSRTAGEAASAAVEMANRRGGRDNVSVIVLAVS